MCTFFKKTIPVNSELLVQIDAEEIDDDFINQFGDEPALNLALQPYPGFLLETLISQKKYEAVKGLLANRNIKNCYQFISIDAYRQLLASNDQALITTCNQVLKECPSPKHQSLVLYPVITEILNKLSSPDLKKKLLHAWRRVNLDELLILNLFLQLDCDEDDLAHFFKGGLFAVPDEGQLRQFFL